MSRHRRPFVLVIYDSTGIIVARHLVLRAPLANRMRLSWAIRQAETNHSETILALSHRTRRFRHGKQLLTGRSRFIGPTHKSDGGLHTGGFLCGREMLFGALVKSRSCTDVGEICIAYAENKAPLRLQLDLRKSFTWGDSSIALARECLASNKLLTPPRRYLIRNPAKLDQAAC
jgi:hypothetical protein